MELTRHLSTIEEEKLKQNTTETNHGDHTKEELHEELEVGPRPSSHSTIRSAELDSKHPKAVVSKYWKASFIHPRKRKLQQSSSKLMRQELLGEELQRLETENILWKGEFSQPAEIIETKNSGSSLTSSATDLGSRKPSGRGTSGRGSASARSTAMGSARGARSTRRKPMSGYVRIEDEINLHHLIKLMRIFHKADEQGSVGLNVRQFKAAFGRILGWKSDEQLVTMFKKIDTKSSGTIDWNNFCTYMLNEYQEREAMVGQKKDLFPYPIKILHSSVHEIASIGFLPSAHRQLHCTSAKDEERPKAAQRSEGVEGRYISVAKDGTLSVWNNNLSLHKTIVLEAGKLPWVTDMVVIPSGTKIIVSLSDNELILYDFTGSNCEVIAIVTHLPSCVLTMCYWFNPSEPNQAMLIMGDMAGGICVMEFTRAMSYHFAPAAGSNNIVDFNELLKQKYEGIKTIYLKKVHSDWVSQVRYWPNLGYVMSCSSEGTSDGLHDGSLRPGFNMLGGGGGRLPPQTAEPLRRIKKPRPELPSNFTKMAPCGGAPKSLHIFDLATYNDKSKHKSYCVRKGITSFDYCHEWNIIATGGLDRVLRFWNPFLTKKAIANLKGHLAAILHVQITLHEHVFSLSKDMELRIWKIGDHSCLQVINRCHSIMPHSPTAFFVHPFTELVLIGSTHLGALEPLNADDKEAINEKVFSHDMPLCAALYNESFNQVVSGCHGSVVSVWDVDTGEKVIQFSRCHGEYEITAMAFDRCGRRLVTGGKDGSIKLWNFNNGECLRVLKNIYNAEVSCICLTLNSIIVGGWFRAFALYSNSRREDGDDEHNTTPKYFGHNLHKEDILCMTHAEPNMLTSASYDGDIYVWDLNTDRICGRLNAWDEQGREPHAGTIREMSLRAEEEDVSLPSSATSSTARSQRSSKQSAKGFHPPNITSKDKRAVEKIIFLPKRELDQSSATVVACGAEGWVHMWNVYGGGLIGEFNIWDNDRHSLERSERSLHAVTALKVDSEGSSLYTGNSLGYIQEWLIADYCLKVDEPVVTEAPPSGLTWKGHTSSVVSIDLAEAKELIITASTDHCVCLWSNKGRYIGTFGEKLRWNLTYPLRDATITRRIPNSLKKSVSFKSVQVMTGSTSSKWRIARNLFQSLRQVKQEQKKMEKKLRQLDKVTPETMEISNKCILGKFYQRKTRFREPIAPMKLIRDGLFSIYGKLKYSDVKDTGDIMPFKHLTYRPGSVPLALPALDLDSFNSISLFPSPVPVRNCHTEKSLLPPISLNFRRHPNFPHSRHVGYVPTEAGSSLCPSPGLSTFRRASVCFGPASRRPSMSTWKLSSPAPRNLSAGTRGRSVRKPKEDKD